MFGRKSKAQGRAPIDLPERYGWARDELVRLRLRNHDLATANIRLRLDLARARGGEPSEALADFFDEVLDRSVASNSLPDERERCS